MLMMRKQTLQRADLDEGDEPVVQTRGRGEVTLKIIETLAINGSTSRYCRLVWTRGSYESSHLNRDFPVILVTAPFAVVGPTDGDGDNVTPINSDLVIPSMLSLATGNFFGDFERDELTRLFMRMLNMRGESIYVAKSATGRASFGWVVDRTQARPDDPSYMVSGYIVIITNPQ